MPTCIAGRSTSARLSGACSGISAASSATRASACSSTATGCRARPSSRTHRLNFAENLLRKRGAARRHRLSRRGQGRAPPVLGRAPRARLAPAAAFRLARRQARRPHRRDDAQHARGRRRHAGRRLARRGLVVLLARFRRAGRARPFRPDRAGASSSRPTATGTTASRTT